jgi:HJR/Mrr/RecB family endonuclease
MSRKQQSKEVTIFEAVTGLAALVLFLYFFSSDFRAGVQIVFAFAVIVFLVWLAYKIIKPELTPTQFKVSTSNPHQMGAPIGNQRPTVFVEDSRSAKHAPELSISERLRKIDWFQFEKLIGLIYQQRGFKVKRLGGANPDGGVDLIVESPTETFVVQCKQWRKGNVSVRQIREFLGILMDSRIPKGIFVTLSGYTCEARQLADKHGIQILNESDLIKMLGDAGLLYSEEIAQLCSDERKFCPRCESEMVLRTNRQTGEQFWGCSTFPRCCSKLNLES